MSGWKAPSTRTNPTSSLPSAAQLVARMPRPAGSRPTIRLSHPIGTLIGHVFLARPRATPSRMSAVCPLCAPESHSHLPVDRK